MNITYKNCILRGKIMIADEFFNKSFNRKYNIEWYLANGDVQTTSAILTDVQNGYIHFIYPNGGLFIIEQKALRSMQCIEDLNLIATR